LVLVFASSAAVVATVRPATKNVLNLPTTPYRYANIELPAHVRQPGQNHDNTPPDNPLSDDGATLGRVLFYDTRLSAFFWDERAGNLERDGGAADQEPGGDGTGTRARGLMLSRASNVSCALRTRLWRSTDYHRTSRKGACAVHPVNGVLRLPI
jgi:hypothetical protein